MRRLSVVGSMLRARPRDEKASIVAAFVERFGRALDEGRIRPVVDRVMPIAEAGAAQAAVEASDHFGKVVLRVR